MTNRSRGDDVAQPEPPYLSLPGPRGGFFSSNPSLVVGDVVEASVRLLAVVLLEVCDRKCSRWVLQEQSADEPCTGRWRFPGTVFAPGEMPLPAAARSVTEKIVMVDAGSPVSWAGLEHSVLGVAMDWLPELRLAADNDCRVEWENTLVFTYHVRLVVPNVRTIEVHDVAANPGCRTWLAGIYDLTQGVSDGVLCPSSEKLWTSYWEQQPR